jgi:hypothetical protein
MGRKEALSTLWLPGPSAVGFARKKRAKIKSTNKMALSRFATLKRRRNIEIPDRKKYKQVNKRLQNIFRRLS